MTGLAALVAKLIFDHSVCGIGWRVHKTSLPELAIAYLIPFGLCLIVYGLAWFSVLTDFLCLRGHSLWPAVLLHASYNVFVQSFFDPLTRNGPYTQYLTSEFGLSLVLGYLAIACFLYQHYRQEFFRQ